MAKSKAQEFLDQVLARVPEGEREAVRGFYSQAADELAATQRTLEEATAQVRETAEKQTAWWNTHKDTVTENKELKKRLEGGTGGVDQATLNKHLGEVEDRVMGTGLALITSATSIAASHLKEFGEALDMEKLAEAAVKAKQDLHTYYNSTVAERRQAATDAARKKEIEDAEARGKKAGVDETVQRFSSQHMPFPSPNADVPTTLSGLKKPADGAAKPDVLAAAVATANEVIAGSPAR